MAGRFGGAKQPATWHALWWDTKWGRRGAFGRALVERGRGNSAVDAAWRRRRGEMSKASGRERRRGGQAAQRGPVRGARPRGLHISRPAVGGGESRPVRPGGLRDGRCHWSGLSIAR